MRFKAIQQDLGRAQVSKGDGQSQADARVNLHLRRFLQAMGHHSAIGPGQAACSQLDATEISGHHGHDLIEARFFKGAQHGAAGGAAGFPVVAEAVQFTHAVGPTVVGGLGLGYAPKKGHGLLRRVCPGHAAYETALFYLFFELEFAGKGQHALGSQGDLHADLSLPGGGACGL